MFMPMQITVQKVLLQPAIRAPPGSHLGKVVGLDQFWDSYCEVSLTSWTRSRGWGVWCAVL